jgi:CDP-diacylglycerol--glycerol-3-phosphate 3-phosphatidyltransferase
VSDALVMWPLVLLPGVSVGWVGAFLWLAAVNEYAGVLGSSVGNQRRYEGPMGKSDRTLVWGVLCIALAVGVDLEPYAMLALQIVMGLLVWSTLRRVANTLKKSKES